MKRSCRKLKLTELMEKWRKWKKGHFAVYTREGRRFVLPLEYLNHPIFQVLLEMAEEEFGSTICGPLQVPCDGRLMDHILTLVRRRSLANDDGDDGYGYGYGYGYDDDVKKRKNYVGSGLSTCKGASSISYLFPLFRCHAPHDQNRLQSLVC